MSEQPAQTPVEHCPECGAPAVDGLGCWEQLGYLLAWEAQDAELAAVHFLTVAAYNLQHPAQFRAEMITVLRAALVEYLDHGAPTSELRRRIGPGVAGSQRVLKRTSERRPVLRAWSMTVADVYDRGNREGAAARVRRWAAATRNDGQTP